MAKYEIMLIVDPKAELDNVHTLTKEVFKEDLVSFEKMERTELAYPIRKQTRAIYALINLATEDTDKIKEFQRRVAISKDI
jgi:small subunit ribosomal protein S6